MLSHLCLPIGMPATDLGKLDDLVKDRVRVEKGRPLFTLGSELDAVYAVRFGSLRTQLEQSEGDLQITGFHLPGEIVGMDSIGQHRHVSSAIAMEDSEVCVIRIDDIDRVGRLLPSLQSQIRRLMSQEISRSQQMLLTLGSMRSEQRVAGFLLNLSQRLSTLGYSSTEFILRMSREKIGNYLGLTLETVSRLLSRFAREGIIHIHLREVRILDMAALQQVFGQEC